MEKFLVKKKIAKTIFQAKLYLLILSIAFLSTSVSIFLDTLEKYPENFGVPQVNANIVI